MIKRKILLGLMIALLLVSSITQSQKVAAQEETNFATLTLTFPADVSDANDTQAERNIKVNVLEYDADGTVIRDFDNQQSGELRFTKTSNPLVYETKVKPGIYEFDFNEAWDTNQYSIDQTGDVKNPQYFRIGQDKFSATAESMSDKNRVRKKYEANQSYAFSVVKKERTENGASSEILPPPPHPMLTVGIPSEAHPEAVKKVKLKIQKRLNDGTMNFDTSFSERTIVPNQDGKIILPVLDDGVYLVTILDKDIHGMNIHPNERDVTVNAKFSFFTGTSINIKVVGGVPTHQVVLAVIRPYIAPETPIVPETPEHETRDEERVPRNSYELAFEKIIDENGVEHNASQLNYQGKFPIDDMIFGLYKDNVEVLGKLTKSRSQLLIGALNDGTYTLKQKDTGHAKILWGGKVNTSLTLQVTAGNVLVEAGRIDDLKVFALRQWQVSGWVGENSGRDYRSIRGEVELGIFRGIKKLRSISSCGGEGYDIGCLINKLNPYENYSIKVESPETSLYQLSESIKNTVINFDWLVSRYQGGLSTDTELLRVGESQDIWSSKRYKKEHDTLKRIADRFEISFKVLGFHEEVIPPEAVEFDLTKNGEVFATDFKVEDNKLKFSRLPIGAYKLIQRNKENSPYQMELDKWDIRVDNNGYATVSTLIDMKFKKVNLPKNTSLEFKHIKDEKGVEHKTDELQYDGVYPIDDVTFKLKRGETDVSELMRKDRTKITIQNLTNGSYTLTQENARTSKVLWNNSLDQQLTFEVTNQGVHFDAETANNAMIFNLRKIVMKDHNARINEIADNGITLRRAITKNELELESVELLTGQGLGTTSMCSENEDEVLFSCLFRNMNPYKKYIIRDASTTNKYKLTEKYQSSEYSLDSFMTQARLGIEGTIVELESTISLDFTPDRWRVSEGENAHDFVERIADRVEIPLINFNSIGKSDDTETQEVPFKLIQNGVEVDIPLEIKEDKLIIEHLLVGEYELVSYIPGASESTSYIKPHKIIVDASNGYTTNESKEPIELSQERGVKLGKIETPEGFRPIRDEDILSIDATVLNDPNDPNDPSSLTHHPSVKVNKGVILINGFSDDRYMITIALSDGEQYNASNLEAEVDMQTIHNYEEGVFKVMLNRMQEEVEIPLVGDDEFKTWIQSNKMEFLLLKDGKVIDTQDDTVTFFKQDAGILRLNKLLAGEYTIQLKNAEGRFYSEYVFIDILDVNSAGEAEWYPDEVEILTRVRVEPEVPKVDGKKPIEEVPKVDGKTPREEPKVDGKKPTEEEPKVDEKKPIEEVSKSKKPNIGPTEESLVSIEPGTEASIGVNGNNQSEDQIQNQIQESGNNQGEDLKLSVGSGKKEAKVTTDKVIQEPNEMTVVNQDSEESLPMTGMGNKFTQIGTLLVGIGCAIILIRYLCKLKERRFSMK